MRRGHSRRPTSKGPSTATNNPAKPTPAQASHIHALLSIIGEVCQEKHPEARDDRVNSP
ncbi:hypothetical protein FAK_24620 [Desulfoferula mesophila]|uniref:Uncharacterized protein n=1 Tax=Desulfoferula mesophila TaxID=3058419 RepID=A0AAU9EYD5_9BACT|nr:hypothetical protein FAK_24620 [Desulfoferula mesophilus]